MKVIPFTICITFILFAISCAQKRPADHEVAEQSGNSLTGAWQSAEEGDLNHLLIVTDRYISEVVYQAEPPDFVMTHGGSYTIRDGIFEILYEYHSLDSTRVGLKQPASISIRDGQVDLWGHTWTRIDDGTPGVLAGAWLITGRERHGELRRRPPEERKTMKILSGTCFQWIAYDTGTGQFFGTGGGTYTTGQGRYTENISFFSRNPARVGATLSFEYLLEGGEWYHSGTSSKGERMMEIWTPRNMTDQMN